MLVDSGYSYITLRCLWNFSLIADGRSRREIRRSSAIRAARHILYATHNPNCSLDSMDMNNTGTDYNCNSYRRGNRDRRRNQQLLVNKNLL